MRFLLWTGFCLMGVLSTAQTSPFNGLKVADSIGPSYSFLVSGHFHGSSQNFSGYPAASLLANLDMINASGASFLCSTGDLFMDVRNNIPQYRKALFSKLKMPLFNAVGNHDISGKVYRENFGDTWFYFTTGNELFIFLDTEVNDGSIKGDQWKFFTGILAKFCPQQQVKNVFIVSHRPVWAEDHDRLKTVFKENTSSDFGNNFDTHVLPLIRKYSKSVAFYWFSGSLGGNAPASFFYHRESPSLYYIQSAIRDLPRDGMLKVNVNNGRVNFETISLSGKPMPELETCNLKMWKSGNPGEGFNYRLVPLYIKQMLFHRYFWYGIGYSLLGCLILFFIRKRYKRKKIA